MENNSGMETYIHIVDNNDIIIYLSDNWQTFADENYFGRSCSPDKLIGTLLWDHIHGIETEYLYELIMLKVRESGEMITLSCRCDSPEKRQFIKLSVISIEGEKIEFRSKIIKTEPREPVDLSNIRLGYCIIKRNW